MTRLEGYDSISGVNGTMASKAGKRFNDLHVSRPEYSFRRITEAWRLHGSREGAEYVEAVYQEVHYSVDICYTHTSGNVLVDIDTYNNRTSTTEGRLSDSTLKRPISTDPGNQQTRLTFSRSRCKPSSLC